ncbi:MAG: hypothetical protein CL566_10875 [Alphaproteobacteria bacterium]|nr:hypothetical protein [Alphaproteobacteria bacterium]|tara:strand:+ start:1759 stop:1992 length:234 start_codon:yes stop_codon:yes gene_type:complete
MSHPRWAGGEQRHRGTITQGPILRICEAHPKPGCADKLLEKFSSTSASVVAGEPGNRGYIFGRGMEGDSGTVLFVSV